MPIYVGRFAPTPSGALHFGSLVTALGSYLDARSVGGRWLLRLDDLDAPRVRTGAMETILRQLHDHGLNWDGPVRRQSEHLPEYREALRRLTAGDRLYACKCSRAQLAALAGNGEDEAAYPGTCRHAGLPEAGAALRFRVDASRGLSDFVVRRRDGVPSYQLACAVDEAASGVTDVVRGADLASSAARQALLLEALGLPVPRYRHLPLVLDSDGRKLGKRNESRPLEARSASINLQSALRVLGQDAPPESEDMEPARLVEAAAILWRPDRIPEGPFEMT